MFERKGRRKVSCRQVDAWLMAYLKDGLAPDRRAAVDEHLAGCEVCRHAVRDARALEAGLRLEATRYNPTLSPTASARIQERVYRRMRRGLIMQRTSRVVGGAAGVVVALVLVAGALLLWQTLRPGEPAGPMGDETPVPGGPAPRQTAAPGQTAITFAAPDGSFDAYRDLAAEFEGLHPDLHVEVVSLEEILGPDLKDSTSPEAALRVVSAADTAWWYVEPGATRQGLVRDLGPLLDADPAFDAADFYPGMLDAYRWDGGLWAVPGHALVTLVYYDKAAFDEAGVPYPQAGWTWDEFVATARAVAKWDGDEVARYGYIDLMGGILQSYLADQGILGASSAGPSAPRFDSPGVVAAVRRYVEMVRTPGITPELPAGQAGLTQAYAMVSDGRAAMWTDLAADHPSHPSGASIYASRDIGVVPFPSDSQGDTNPLQAFGYVMSAGTTQPEAAWRWLNFLTRQGSVRQTMGMAARRSAAEGSGFWDGLDDDLAAALRYALEHPFVTNPANASLTRALSQALAAVLQEGEDVEQALAEAQQAVTSAASEVPAGEKVEVPPVPPPQEVRGSPASDETVTITFVLFLADSTAYRTLAERFHETHPDITVEVRPLSMSAYGGRLGLEEAAAAGDCLLWAAGAADLERGPYVLSLDPFLSADAGFSEDDYYPAFQQMCEQGGQSWCLPYDARPGVVQYNRDLFDASGVAYPELDWTLDDLVEKAAALTQGEGAGKQYGFSGYGNEEMALEVAVRLHGGALWDTAASPPRSQFDDPAVVDAVRWYAGLAGDDGIRPAVHLSPPMEQRIEEYRGPMGAVEEGRVAMWTQLAGVDEYQQRVIPSMGMAPFPQQNGRRPFIGHVEAHYISAQTDHPQACWDWLTFLADHAGAVQGMPARRSLAESTEFAQQVGAEAAAIYLAAVEQPDPVFEAEAHYSWMYTAEYWFRAAYDAVLDGGDAGQALGEAQRKATAFVTCIETRHDLEGYELAEACALQVDPEYPAVP